MTTGAALRDSGVADVLAADTAVHRDFAPLIREAVEVVGADGAHFTSDDIRAWLELTYPDRRPHHANVYGGTLQRLADARRLVPVGYRPSTRPGARHRIVRVWRAP
ncbi:MAG: hypothetical protein Q4F65_11990 [Propionibacteriaceae bacterium]|nr:hypothetical protein [Propionibacteriaceae bacterium]